MIINARGSNGSGKSHIAFELLARYPNEKLFTNDGKIEGYRVKVPEVTKDLVVIGKYERPSMYGGADIIKVKTSVFPLVERYVLQGYHVYVEGFTLSMSLGSFGDLGIKAFGDDLIFAFLDTPLDVCKKRVLARRTSDKLGFNDHFEKDYTYLQTWRGKIKARGGNVVILDHTRADEEVLELLQYAT